VRLRLLLAVLRGATGPAELAEVPGIGTSGQIYHHIRTLTAAGWLRASGRRPGPGARRAGRPAAGRAGHHL
jgi:hypothetical protein